MIRLGVDVTDSSQKHFQKKFHDTCTKVRVGGPTRSFYFDQHKDSDYGSVLKLQGSLAQTMLQKRFNIASNISKKNLVLH